MPADGGDPAAGCGGLYILMISVVRALGGFARLPGPDAAVLAGDDGLVLVGGGPAGFHAFGQADLDHGGGAVGQVIGVPVCVQEEKPRVERLGLNDAHARVLFDACGLDVAGVVRIPVPSLPVRVQGEDPAVGGDGGDGLCPPRQAGRGLFGGFRVQVLAVGIAGLVGVDPSLLVHGQQPVAVYADVAELGAPAGVEDGGRRLPAGPGVDVLVGSESGLPMAVGCGLQVVEPVFCLGGGGNLYWRAVLRPCVDAALACQTDSLLSSSLDAGVVGFLLVGWADGQLGAGGGPVVRAQRPVSYLGPLAFQTRVLQDRGPEVERLAVKRPPIE